LTIIILQLDIISDFLQKASAQLLSKRRGAYNKGYVEICPFLHLFTNCHATSAESNTQIAKIAGFAPPSFDRSAPVNAIT
jgi:hypothetical protein